MIAYLIFLDSTILYGTPQQQYPIKRCISLIIIIFTIIRSEIRHVPEATNVITILYTERYNSAGCHNIVSNWILSCSSYSWLIQIVYWVTHSANPGGLLVLRVEGNSQVYSYIIPIRNTFFGSSKCSNSLRENFQVFGYNMNVVHFLTHNKLFSGTMSAN